MIMPECTHTYQILLLEHRSLQLLSYIIFSSSNSVPVPYNLLGLLIIGLGVYLVLQSVLLLRSYNTTIEPGGNPSSLATKCPYNHSRNPIYFVRMYDSSNTLIQERLLAYEKIFAKYGKKQNLVLRATKEIEHY